MMDRFQTLVSVFNLRPYVMTIREFRAAVAALFPRGVPSYRHLDAMHPAFLDPVVGPDER